MTKDDLKKINILIKQKICKYINYKNNTNTLKKLYG